MGIPTLVGAFANAAAGSATEAFLAAMKQRYGDLTDPNNPYANIDVMAQSLLGSAGEAKKKFDETSTRKPSAQSESGFRAMAT